MKFLLLIFILATAALVAVAQQSTARDLEGLKGKVRTVEIWYQDTDRDGKPIYSNQRQSLEEYDEAGNLVRSTYYVSGERRIYSVMDGKRVWRSERFEGPEVRSLITVAGSTDHSPPVKKSAASKYDGRFGYKFDKAGRIVELEEYTGDDLREVRKFTYDAAGRIAGETSVVRGRLSDGSVYRFDSKGIVTGRDSILYMMSGEKEITPFRYSNIKVDSHGNWTERTVSQGEGKDAEFVAIESRKVTYH